MFFESVSLILSGSWAVIIDSVSVRFIIIGDCVTFFESVSLIITGSCAIFFDSVSFVANVICVVLLISFPSTAIGLWVMCFESVSFAANVAIGSVLCFLHLCHLLAL